MVNELTTMLYCHKNADYIQSIYSRDAMLLGIEIVAYLQDPSRIDGDFRNPLPNIRLGFQEKVEAFEEL